jgi:hypothetical protein
MTAALDASGRAWIVGYTKSTTRSAKRWIAVVRAASSSAT